MTITITSELAVRLARLSKTEPEFWLSLQQAYDLWHTEQAMAKVLTQLPTHPLADAVRMEIDRHGHSH